MSRQNKQKNKKGHLEKVKKKAKRKRLNILFSRLAEDFDVNAMASFVYNVKESFTVIDEKSLDCDKESVSKASHLTSLDQLDGQSSGNKPYNNCLVRALRRILTLSQ